MTAAGVSALLSQSLRDPQAGFATLRRQGLTAGERLALACLVSIFNVLATEAFLQGLPDQSDPGLILMLDRPILFAGLQLGGMGLMACLVHVLGRAFGGRGDWAGAVDLVILLQAVLFLFQLAQLLSLLLLPPLTAILGLASLGAALWYLTQFLVALHGFTSPGRTFLGLVLCLVILTLILATILALFIGAEPPNV